MSIGTDTPHPNHHTDQDRYQHGLEVLDAVDGAAGHAVVAALADIAPDLAHHIVAYGFGDIYARPGLAPQQRQLLTLGILTAQGGCEPQLEVHINASLNVGLTSTEIVESLIHSAVYCGFSRALNAVFVAKRVFSERGLLPVNPDIGAQSATHLTRRTLETFFRRLAGGEDVNDMFADVVDHYVPGAESVPWTGRRSTRSEVAEFFAMLCRHLEPRLFEVSRLIVNGADAVALGRFGYTVRSNGRPFDGQFALHLTVNNTAIVRYHMYEDSYALDQALTGH